MIQSSFAGTPDQDPTVKAIRNDFVKALSTYPTNGFEFGQFWTCTTHDAFRDDFYSEPGMTFRFAFVDGYLVNTGNSIFKDIQMTDTGLKSIRRNPAYCNTPVYMTMRPHFEYNSCDPQTQQNCTGNDVKHFNFIGEVSVEPSALADMATYYGYHKPFRGVAAAADPTKIVYFYMVCHQTDADGVATDERQNATWSIPAELSRHWPHCTHCSTK